MHEILNTRIWALESFFLERAKVAILRGMETGDMSNLDIWNPSKKREAKEIYAGLSWNSEIGAYVHTGIAGKNIAHIPVLGSITKRGGMCTYGSKDYINRINNANLSHGIDAIVLEIDGPGGSVDGTEEFGMAVKNSTKPIVAYVDGMSASAHYWVTSQAQYIVANSEITSWIGSIGTLVVHLNESGWLTQNGIEVEIIRAPQSTDKARENSLEPLTPVVKERLLAELASITDHFIGTVKAGRGDKLTNDGENIFTGKVYNGGEALRLGMIDEIGPLKVALNKAAELASNSKTNNNTKIHNSMKLKNLFKGSKAAEEENVDTTPPEVQSATVQDAAPNKWKFGFSKNVTVSTGFTCKINDVAATIEGYEGSGTSEVVITTTEAATSEDTLTYDYSEGDCVDESGNALEDITGESVTFVVAEEQESPAEASLKAQLKAAKAKIAQLEKRPAAKVAAAVKQGDENGGAETEKLNIKDEQAHRFAKLGASRKNVVNQK